MIDMMTDDEIIQNLNDKIQQLEIENAHLKLAGFASDGIIEGLKLGAELLRKENAHLKQYKDGFKNEQHKFGMAFLKADKLERKLEIATKALKFAESEIHSEFCGNKHHPNCNEITEARKQIAEIK